MSDLKQIIGKKLYELSYDLERKSYLKHITNDLGDIVENNDSILCYVKQKKLDKIISLNRLSLLGMNTYSEFTKNQVYKYKLDKPVYYVFDNIAFPYGLMISSHFVDTIEFKNCTFGNKVSIDARNSNVLFKNNKYDYDVNIKEIFGNGFLRIKNASRVSFCNENFVNSSNLDHPLDFEMDINSKDLEIINSGIECGKKGNLSFNTENIFIYGSVITTSGLYIDTKSIETVDNCILAREGAIIKSNNLKLGNKIQGPVVIYEDDIRKDNTIELEKNRLGKELAKRLGIVVDKCLNINNDRAIEVKKKFNEEPVSHVLKRTR